MARINRKELMESQAYGKYRALAEKAKDMSENRDCAVKAVALVCGVSYEVAHDTLAKAGRQSGKGTFTHIIKQACNDLGYRAIELSMAEKIAQYPGNHKNLRSITNHHPHRFNKVWKDGKNYLFLNATHVAAVMDGELIDWSVGRPMPLIALYHIVKV
ncbi:MAG: hypothetical protein EBY29_15805 [Planctomycetes bacterium]|nr:hypothetical protein [Planctomycetota bacterium]